MMCRKQTSIIGLLTAKDLTEALAREGLVPPKDMPVQFSATVTRNDGSKEKVDVSHGIRFEYELLPNAAREQG
jgi:hypothetical protein